MADSPGIALLITCDYAGTSAGTIPGTNVDAEKMRRAFEHLNYVIYQLRSRESTKANIKAKVNEIAGQLKNYRGPTADKVIVFAYSGHGIHEGDTEYIVTHDDKKLHIIEDLIQPLETEAVAKIPKLFFIDFCHRGKRLDALTNSTKPAPAFSGPSGGAPKNDPQEIYNEPKTIGYMWIESNYRIDISVISGHINGQDQNGSIWMRTLAGKLVDECDSIQNLAADVKKTVHYKRGEPKQVVRSFDRLDTGPLYLTRQY